MTTPTPTFDAFSPFHLSWMIHRNLIPFPTTLGMISGAEPEEFTEELRKQLQQWSVIDNTNQLTPDAHDLFRGLYEYDFAYWGVLLLHNEKEPFQIEMDQELIDIGIGRSISDTPRVYWQVSYSNSTITVAMRAGDNLTLNTMPADEGNLYESLARAILTVLNPNGIWPAAQFTTVKIPLEVVEKIPTHDASGKKHDKSSVVKTMKYELAKRGVAFDTSSRFVKLINAEKLADTEVLFMPKNKISTSEFFTIEFVHKVGMVLTRTGTDVEGNPVIVQEGATIGAIAEELRKLKAQ